MQVASLPTNPSPGPAPADVLRRSSAADALATGLASLAAARSLGEVYRQACALIARFPHVEGVAVLRQDDRGILVQAYTPPAKPLPPAIATRATAALHQRWIAAHGPNTPVHGFVPFTDAECPELLVAPMVHDEALLGGLAVSGRDGHAPAASPAERTAIAALAVVAAQAIAAIGMRGRLEQSISRSEHESALTDARKTIARELHDGPAQDLALAGLTLDRLVTTLGADQAISADARQARDLIDRAVLGMRKAIGKLRAAKAPAPSITGPLRELLKEMAPAAPGLEVDFGGVSGVHLAPEVERAVVGIVREALHNVRKHAQADSVRLEVRRQAEGMEVAVIDDGVGFDGTSSPPNHFGLEQIRELAEGTGGSLEIGSTAGRGTTVRAWIPLGQGTTDRLGRTNPGRRATS